MIMKMMFTSNSYQNSHRRKVVPLLIDALKSIVARLTKVKEPSFRKR